ncbi:hypothetical protein V2S66_26125 [Streptomyces sp. V4-01]|uniref:Uncharacterized protein n=1 Tax=Actinacidiphila polyblastidii TaxID=3110430 RepID=A0ABU7PHX5_9ACTN|nr:hypothetical protein [Streptomyces sp. V4-01]
MGRRPRDWHPLAAADPVPGDPDAILDEVAHLKHVATLLRREAGDLRVIAQGDGLVGRYAEALRDGARDLEGHLGETAGRYERVHGHLTCWAHELAGLQADAARILRAAREDAGADPGSGSGADDPLAAHRASLAKVEALRDERAGHYGHLLGHQIDDKIKDSRWQRLKNAVHDWQGVISLAVDVMSWTATVIAVAALLTTPAGWVAGLALWLSFGVLAGHLLLAAAGDGSWADIAMDAFGLLTMHVGNAALTELRAVRDATKRAAQAAADEAAAANSARATQAVRDRASAVVNRRGATRAERAKARHDRNIARASNRRAGRDAADAEASTPMPEATRWEAVRMGGEKESMNVHKDIQRMRAAYPRNAAVALASEGADARKRVFEATWMAATTVDGFDKGAGSSDIYPSKWQYGPYGRLKDRYTREIGSAW